MESINFEKSGWALSRSPHFWNNRVQIQDCPDSQLLKISSIQFWNPTKFWITLDNWYCLSLYLEDVVKSRNSSKDSNNWNSYPLVTCYIPCTVLCILQGIIPIDIEDNPRMCIPFQKWGEEVARYPAFGTSLKSSYFIKYNLKPPILKSSVCFCHPLPPRS